MSKKSEKLNFEPFEHERGTKAKDYFVRVYGSMMNSAAWRDLTLRQQGLYIAMKRQYNPAIEIGGIGIEPSRKNFNFSAAVWEKYYGKSNTSWYDDEKALISHGFIDKLQSGKSSRTKNVYCFSERWKSWSKNEKACGNTT